MRTRAIIGLTLALGVLTVVAPAGRAANSLNPEQTAIDQTPPRLSYTNGQVSFWRPGADDWAQAQVNTPLAAGDELYTDSPATLELQIGAHAFVRGQANTQIGLANQEANFLQFKVTTGSAVFDLRTLEPGRLVEVDTPNAAFTIDRAGYYRVDVTGERTTFIARRAGLATVTPATGEPVVITPSAEVVIDGITTPQLASYAVPQLDAWDNWNYARSDRYQNAVSARYVSPETYGVSDLDHYGTWRNVPDYGSVWVPTAAQAGWTPYSTGSWTQDPSYGWTWVDTAPWGWAPYHYGRWVSLGRTWAWAPGPVVARPVYAPALVAFFGGPAVSVGISIGGLTVGWVPLGWGEPVVPWWGRAGVVREPSWRGWGGPRVVNNTVINNTTVVNVQNINVYRNSGVQNAVVMVPENRFGRGPITSARIAQTDVRSLQVIHTAPQVATTPASFVPTATRGIRPPEESLKRSVVATRAPVLGHEAAAGAERKVRPAGIPAPAPRLVSAPPPPEIAPVPARPPGQSTVERPAPARAAPPPPPGAPVPPPGKASEKKQPQVKAPAPPPPGRAEVPPQVEAPVPPPPGRAETPPQVKAPAPPPPGRVETPPQVKAPAPPSPGRAETPPQVKAPAPPPPGRAETPPQVKAPAPPSPGRAETPPQVKAPAPPSPGRVETPPQVKAPAPPSPGRAETPPQVKAPAPPPPGRAETPPQVKAPAPPPPGRVETPPQVKAPAPPPPGRVETPPQVKAPAPPPPGRVETPPQVKAPAPPPPGRVETPPQVKAPAPPPPGRAETPPQVKAPAPPPPGRVETPPQVKAPAPPPPGRVETPPQVEAPVPPPVKAPEKKQPQAKAPAPPPGTETPPQLETPVPPPEKALKKKEPQAKAPLPPPAGRAETSVVATRASTSNAPRPPADLPTTPPPPAGRPETPQETLPPIAPDLPAGPVFAKAPAGRSATSQLAERAPAQG